MSGAMNKLHLIFIAFFLWGDTNGFSVWNRTSVVDWQAGRSSATWNQNLHLATPVQPFQLLSRKGANENVGEGGNSSSVMLTSEVQTAQHDSSFVQSSGGAAHGKPVLNAHSQAAPTIQHQDNYTAQSSRLYWYKSLKPNNCGPSLSQSWPVKAHYAPGFQRPSSSQSAGTTNQVSGSQSQSLYQLSSTTPVLMGQSATSPAQSSGDSTLYQGQVSSRYISQDQRTTSYSQSVANTNRVSGFQTQSLYQPSTTAQVSASQSASTSQAQGRYGAESSGHAKWYSILQGQIIPSSSQSVVTTNQISGSQTQSSYQPSSTTLVLAGQSASTPQAQSSGASLYQGLSFGGYLTSQGQSIPSSSQSVVTTNQISGFQNQTSYRPNSTTRVSASQSASTSQAQVSYGAESSGHANWYSILQGQTIPSSLQVSGSQTQSSYQPSSTTLVLVGESASTPQAQSSGASTLYQGLTSGSYLISQNQRMPSSSQTAVNTEQISGFQNHSSQPSPATQVVDGQSVSSFQAQGSYGAESSRPAKWYNVLWGQNIPSSSQVSGFQTQSLYQPSSTAQVLAGHFASTSQAQSSDASVFYQGQASSKYISQNQNIPSYFQSGITTNQISGSQTQLSYQLNSTAQVSTGHSASMSQAQSSGASTLYQDPTSGRNLTSQGQTIPFSSQSVVTTNRFSGFQNQTFQPNTTTQALVGHSASTSRVQGSQQAAKWQMMNPSGFRTWLLNTSISPSLRSDTQLAISVLSFLNQSAGTSAMSQNNVHSPAFHTSTQFSPVTQTAASPSVSLAKPSQQTQGSMVQSGIASLATSQTSPHVEATSQGTDIYAAVPSQGTSQNFAGTSFQGALPQVRRDDQYSPVCNFSLGFCVSSQGAANNKFV